MQSHTDSVASAYSSSVGVLYVASTIAHSSSSASELISGPVRSYFIPRKTAKGLGFVRTKRTSLESATACTVKTLGLL